MRLIKFVISFCCALAVSFSFAQNLIPNAGFENLSGSLTGEGQINVATGWSAPLSSTGTPDLYNTAFIGPILTPCDNVGVPFNIGGIALAHNGNGFAGISNDFANGYYEYITVKLDLALTPGEVYLLDMWVMRADSSRFANNRLGVVLSSSLMTQTGSALIPFPTQFESIHVNNDASNWYHLLFTPYQALGGEQYMTIGVFRAANDPVLTIQDMGTKNSGCASLDNRSYIYIDDVTLVPSNVVYVPPVDTAYVCPYNYTSTIYPLASNIAVTWTDQYGNVLPSNDGGISVPDSASLALGLNVPGATITYYVLGNGQLDSVKLLVINPPIVDLGLDTTYCESDSVKLNAYQANAISYLWSNGDTLSYSFATDTGHYSVTVANPGCSISDSIYFYKLLPNPPINIGEDSLFCFYNFDSLRLDATTDDAVSYFWKPTGEFMPKITVKYPGFYSVAVTRTNGCVRKAGFEVMEVCAPVFYAPNAFTPDGDGINDLFSVYAENYSGFTLLIYDRYGQKLFETDNPAEGWNGYFKGKSCPIGVYTYKISISGFNIDGEKEHVKSLGTFVLYR